MRLHHFKIIYKLYSRQSRTSRKKVTSRMVYKLYWQWQVTKGLARAKERPFAFALAGGFILLTSHSSNADTAPSRSIHERT